MDSIFLPMMMPSDHCVSFTVAVFAFISTATTEFKPASDLLLHRLINVKLPEVFPSVMRIAQMRKLANLITTLSFSFVANR